MMKRILLTAGLSFAAVTAALAQARTPTDAIDGFHTALRLGDTAAAISLLARDLVVYEFGVIDPTLEAYAFRHLPVDMDLAAGTEWTLEERQVGGEGDTRWVASTYRVDGYQPTGDAFTYRVMESAVVVRSGDGFRVAHFHWSTDNAEFLALNQGLRLQAPAQ
jgi:ketosteroid isomerase-like protein